MVQARTMSNAPLERSSTEIDSTIEADVLVVGAGPGGSMAAKRAAETGVKVLLVEKKTTIGDPVQCAEYLPLAAARYTAIHPTWIAGRIRGMLSHYPDGTSQETGAPGYILNRILYDRGLAALAAKAGAEILTRAAASNVSDEGAIVKQGPKTIDVHCNSIIGADGPDSTVASWSGQKNRNIMTAHQVEVKLREPSDMTEVWFGPEYPRGYAWLFPKGETANVGVGVSPAEAAKPALEHFTAQLRKEGRIGDILGTTAGRIPVNGPLETLKGNHLLVGDAGGQTHPITGAGIFNAVIAGHIAGHAAGEAARTGDLSHLDAYESLWFREFGGSLARAKRKREILDKGWETAARDPAELTRLIRRTWVVCPEYYDDREDRRS